MTRAWQGWNGPARLHGIDLARGLAVLGMLAAHLVALPEIDASDPATWTGIASGRSSILFATLAGVSVALVTGAQRPVVARERTLARYRLATRAGVLWLLGIVLLSLSVPVAVILPAYAFLFLLALPLLGLGAGALWVLAGVLALAMPWLQPFFDALPIWDGPTGHDLGLMVGWAYPVPVWSAFLVAGMAAGRSDLRRMRTQVLLATGGAAAAVVGYGLDAAGHGAGSDYLDAVRTAEPHSSGILEVIGSGGFALAVVAVCLLVCRTVLTWLVLPIRAVGTMPLTAYTGQIVAWAIAASILTDDHRDLEQFRALEPFWWFAVMTLVCCTAWALLLGRGPLERLVGAVSDRVAVTASRHRPWPTW